MNVVIDREYFFISYFPRTIEYKPELFKSYFTLSPLIDDDDDDFIMHLDWSYDYLDWLNW